MSTCYPLCVDGHAPAFAAGVAGVPVRLGDFVNDEIFAEERDCFFFREHMLKHPALGVNIRATLPRRTFAE